MSLPIFLSMCIHISGCELVCIMFLKPSVLLLSGSCLAACWSSQSLLINSFHKSCAAGNSHLASWMLVEKAIPHVDGNCGIVQEHKLAFGPLGFQQHLEDDNDTFYPDQEIQRTGGEGRRLAKASVWRHRGPDLWVASWLGGPVKVD